MHLKLGLAESWPRKCIQLPIRPICANLQNEGKGRKGSRERKRKSATAFSSLSHLLSSQPPGQRKSLALYMRLNPRLVRGCAVLYSNIEIRTRVLQGQVPLLFFSPPPSLSLSPHTGMMSTSNSDVDIGRSSCYVPFFAACTPLLDPPSLSFPPFFANLQTWHIEGHVNSAESENLNRRLPCGNLPPWRAFTSIFR